MFVPEACDLTGAGALPGLAMSLPALFCHELEPSTSLTDGFGRPLESAPPEKFTGAAPFPGTLGPKILPDLLSILSSIIF